MAYDAMGNYIGYEDFSAPVAPVMPIGMETEEQRKKREEEERKRAEKEAKRADETAVQEQKVITYENGSKTIETKQEVPAGSKVQPVAPDDYNARIARQESGSRPDIGYHDRSKGTASGMYGMTDAGYADARRRDPNLPEDRLQSSPEQQTQAMNAYTQQNAKYLQNYGVEPNENTLAAAHFLGAKGLSDYLKTGYISEAAAKANGGVENVKRIVDQRLGGQAGPASGAVQQRPQPVQPVAPQAQPAPQAQAPVAPISPEQAQAPRPAVNADEAAMAQDKAQNYLQTQTAAINRYAELQNDPAALMKMGTDENVPDVIRERARNRAADVITQQREQAKAQKEMADKNPSELARMMTERKKDGSWGKYILFGALGMTALRDEEAGKLGIGTDKIITDADGKSYLIKVGANGAPIEGFNSEGRALKPEELIQAMGAGSAPKKDIVGGTFVNDKTGEVGRVVTDPKTGASYVQTDAGRKPMAGFRPQTGTGTMDMQKAQQVQKQNIDLAGDWAKLQMKVQGAAPEAANKYLGEFNAKHGTQFGMQSISGAAPQISMESGQMTQAAPQAQAQAQAAPQAAQAAPQAPAANVPVAPQGQAQIQPVNPNAPRPVVGATPAAATTAPAAGATPAAIEAAAETRKAEEKLARDRIEAEEKSKREVAETGGKEEIKKITEMRIALPKTERATSATLKVIDDVLSHPGFSDVIGMPNILTGIFSPPTTDARNFKTKYEQLKGKAFMEAYNGLRGTGSISEAEGMRAETAIAALNDPYISEKEFKRNAEIFKTTMRNGIDNERLQVGQEPRYKKFTAAEQEAFQWLQKNPKDPRADAIRLKLERSGD
jgi:hypothetical protein